MIRAYDDLLKVNVKKLYLYGAKNVAMEIKDFFNRNSIAFEGYIVSKPENNKTEIDGKPVQALSELEVEFSEISVIVACSPNFKKEIVNALLNVGVYKIYLLDNTFAAELQVQAKVKKIFADFAQNYYIDTPPHLEWWQGLVRKRDSNDVFRLRTEINRIWSLTQQADKFLFKDDNLKTEFETLWCKFVDVKKLPRSGKKNSIKDFANIYSIRCHVDKVFENKEKFSYITDLQAGAALAPKRICDIADNDGENISDRNKDFSECSAIYWAWKNACEKEYVGCMHYRRHLDVTEDDLFSARSNDVGLINTIPSILFPNIKSFFVENFLFDKDWELMMEAIQKLHPEYLQSTMLLASGHYYLANNIFIMKSSWFKKMGTFVFDVLLYIDDFYKASGFVRQDRYAGYIFEFLYSVFVFHHAKEMNVAFADMKAFVFA